MLSCAQEMSTTVGTLKSETSGGGYDRGTKVSLTPAIDSHRPVPSHTPAIFFVPHTLQGAKKDTGCEHK